MIHSRRTSSLSWRSTHASTNSATIYAILIAAALLGRVALIVNKPYLEHDETISYLAAAGHQRDYAQVIVTGQAPVNEWVPAREWQRFMEPDKPLIFGQIAHDLAAYDIHPPLYFWLMHIWILFLGTAVWVGSLLNLLIDLCTGLALYRLAHGTGGALAAVALWALSPVALETMIVARQYGLFTLLAVLYALALRATSDTDATPRTDRVPWMALILIGAAGLLTHFYFILVLLAGGILMITQRDRTRLIVFVGCSALAMAILALLYADFLNPVQRVAGRGLEWSAINVRLGNIVGTLTILLIPIMAALILPLIGGLSVRNRVAKPALHESGTTQSAIFLACLTGGPALLYLGQISPKHALMDYRYFGPAWPFATLLIIRALDAWAFTRLGEMRRVLACLGMLVLTIAMFLPDLRPYTSPASDTRILIDSTARGILLPVIFQLDGETPVFVAEQRELMTSSNRWLCALREHGGLYIHLPRTLEEATGHKAILALIAASADVSTPAELFVWQADNHRSNEHVVRITPVTLP